jgi:hypothetical protein
MVHAAHEPAKVDRCGGEWYQLVSSPLPPKTKYMHYYSFQIDSACSFARRVLICAIWCQAKRSAVILAAYGPASSAGP